MHLTLWGGFGTGWGPIWDRFGTDLGPIWARLGTDLVIFDIYKGLLMDFAAFCYLFGLGSGPQWVLEW